MCDFCIYYDYFYSSPKPFPKTQGIEGEDEGAISMLSDNTAKLTSAVR